MGRRALQSPLDRVARAAWRAIVPPPRLNVSDWLDANRIMGGGYPSPFPGPWRTERTPYLRAPLDDFADPEVQFLVLLFSSQIGKTEDLLGSLMYSYGVDAGPGMLVLPTLDLARGMSTDRLAQALRTCPSLRVGNQRSRNSDDAVFHKRINGFPLTLSGANSPASLSSRPVRNLYADEIDRWPSTTAEGDPLALAIQRTAAYRRRKIVLTSTPTIKHASRIEDWYERSDKHELMSPCPRCGSEFVIMWRHVRWDTGQPETAHIECPTCEGRIEDSERQEMIAASRWVSTAPFVGGVRGYRAWAVVAPWVRLDEIVSSFLVAKKKPDTLQAWINLTLGESWEAPSEKVESASLLLRRERYEAVVPERARVLTLGVDTQDDRLEYLVVGWGAGEESWIVEREALYGDPSKPEVWAELDEVLRRAWARPDYPARIQCTLVDALGHKTEGVYRAVVPRQGRHVFASIGRDGGDSTHQLVSKSKVLDTRVGNVTRYVVDASQVKSLIYSRIKDDATTGPGVVHYPMEVGDGFFTELTAEHLVTERNKYGVPSKRWALRPGVTRNETLDCFGLALAAFRIVCPTVPAYEALCLKLDTHAAQSVERPAAPRGRRTQNWSPGD